MNDPNYFQLRQAWDEQQQTRRRQTPHCGTCGQRIVYVKSARSGRLIPCDHRLDYGDGKKTLVTHDGRMIVKAEPHVLGREPHFGTCKRLASRDTEPEESPLSLAKSASHSCP